MSRTAKIFLATSVGLSAFTVWGVHYLQHKERDTMFAGVLRDDARQKAKKAEREARALALEEEARKRAFLERTQPVTNASEGSRQALEGGKELQPMDVVEFQGCTTCR